MKIKNLMRHSIVKNKKNEEDIKYQEKKRNIIYIESIFR